MDSFLRAKILPIFFHFLFRAVFCNSYCYWSDRTLALVENCPQNEESTRIRAQIKACERLADVQNCTTPSKFKYHCLSTQTPGILVEICAVEMDIDGVCMIYNTALGRLQTYDNVNCKDIIPKCPDNYLSTVAHLYAPCYQFVDIFNFSRENKRNRTIVGEKEKITTFHSITYLAIGITGIVMFGTLVIGMIILRTVKHKGRGKRKWRRNKSDMTKHEEIECFNRKSSSFQTNDLWVSSIYIGDKYCGMAYLDPKHPENVESLGRKEIIGVLLTKDGEVKEFGDKARKMFTENREDSSDYIFLDHDKLDIELGNDYISELPSLKIIDVYQSIIGFLVRKIVETVVGPQEKEGTSCKSESCLLCKMHCVITVPHHWKGYVRDLRTAFDRTMKEIHEDVKKEQLHIKLREVAISPYIQEVKASVICFNFNVDNLIFRENTTYVNLHVGSKYCNLTLLSVLNPESPDRIIGEPYRQQWKKKTPEVYFVKLLKDLFSEAIFKEWKVKYYWEYISLMCQFEDQKNKMRENMDDNEEYEFRLSSTLLKIFEDGGFSPTNLRDRVTEKGGILEIKDSACSIIFKWSLLKTFFTHIKDSTREIIRNHKQEIDNRGVRCVIMTGSYSQMKLFMHEAEKEWFNELSSTVTVFIPVHTGSTYAMGAAYFFKKYPTWIFHDLISNK